MTMIGWLVIFVFLVGIEAATFALTTIWFAGGALAAFFAALAGASIKVQLILFLIVSFVLLFFTRPFVMKYINKGTVATNVDGMIGKKARVTALINNGLSQGTVVFNGLEWSARSLHDDAVIEEGETVVIKEVRGVKVIVEKEEQ